MSEVCYQLGALLTGALFLAAIGIIVHDAWTRYRKRKQDEREGYADGLDGKRAQRGRSPAYHHGWQLGASDIPRKTRR